MDTFAKTLHMHFHIHLAPLTNKKLQEHHCQYVAGLRFVSKACKTCKSAQMSYWSAWISHSAKTHHLTD